MDELLFGCLSLNLARIVEVAGVSGDAVVAFHWKSVHESIIY